MESVYSDIMKDYYPPLNESQFYHVYNRENNREHIFYLPKNYGYFLRKYDEFLSDYLETHAYCLIPNHFHFLVRVKESDAITQSDGIDPIDDLSRLVGEQFRRFFIGYSQAINKQEKRTGSLFQKGFKRIHIDSHEHLLYLVYYIHANPQNHDIVEDFRKYEYSSYARMLLDKPTKLQKREVLEWFGSKSYYAEFHDHIQDLKAIDRYIIEDEE